LSVSDCAINSSKHQRLFPASPNAKRVAQHDVRRLTAFAALPVNRVPDHEPHCVVGQQQRRIHRDQLRDDPTTAYPIEDRKQASPNQVLSFLFHDEEGSQAGFLALTSYAKILLSTADRRAEFAGSSPRIL
jgi:hypothetical protein